MLAPESLSSNPQDRGPVDPQFNGWYRNDFLHPWRGNTPRPAETAVILDAKPVAPVALTSTVEVIEVPLPSAA